MSRVSKNQLLVELNRMLGDLFTEHNRGASGTRLARAHGYLDGYMRGLVDAGVLSSRELLSLVDQQRRLVNGPAKAQLAPDSSPTDSAGADSVGAELAA